MGDFSIELCGGTHVKNTSDIGAFKIISEGSVSSGVRRIEAITGRAVFEHYAEEERKLFEAAAAAKTTPDKLTDRIAELQKQIKELQNEITKIKSEEAKQSMGDIEIHEVGGINLVVKCVKGLDMNQLRDLGDQIKDSIGEGVVILASDSDGKVNLIVTATQGAVDKGANAGKIIKSLAPLVGGGGGGRPNMAQAGGKNPAGIPELIAKAKDFIF